MTATESIEAPIAFTAPGPGEWMLDTTHHGTRPITRFMWPLQQRAFESGMPAMMERYGLPLAGALMREVHGLGYVRLLAVGEKAESSGKTPPLVLLKVLSRLHPELRRRTRTAALALDEKAWRRDVAWWFEEQRPRAVAANIQLQQIELPTLSDQQLTSHIDDLVDNFKVLADASFANHGGDLVPVGLFLSACAGWGISAKEASSLLGGASPATLENDRLLSPVARAIARSGRTPQSVDEIRGLGDDVGRIVDEWLTLHGWRLISSDDIDAPTLAEQPDLQLRALCGARSDQAPAADPDPSDSRSRVPAASRDAFDASLAEARHGLTQRDDAVGVAWNWPAGLIRRGLLEVGRRLVDRGFATDASHAVELDEAEVMPALKGAGPGSAGLADRRLLRDRVEAANPPLTLGPESGPPPLEAFPQPLATMAGAILAVIDAMESTDESEDLVGTGIGSGVYRGRACVVRSPVDSLDQLRADDVLVVPFTSPSYNSLFPLVGAMVTDHGGPMSHTAIMAREFGVPAVVGTGTATSRINDGDIIEVDPAASTVRIVS